MPEPTRRETALRKIKAGDIFHGEGDHGGSLICLATSITETTINARTVTHQLEFKFDRRTGLGQEPEYSIKGVIDSVAPLPPEIYDAFIGLDARSKNEKGPLTEAEKKALLFVAKFYPQNQIDEH